MNPVGDERAPAAGGEPGKEAGSPPAGWISAEREKELLNRIEYLRKSRKEVAGDWARVHSNVCQVLAMRTHLYGQARVGMLWHKERIKELEGMLNEAEAKVRAAEERQIAQVQVKKEVVHVGTQTDAYSVPRGPVKELAEANTQTDVCVNEVPYRPRILTFPTSASVTQTIHPIVPPEGILPAMRAPPFSRMEPMGGCSWNWDPTASGQ